jgi:hypothetical protein
MKNFTTIAIILLSFVISVSAGNSSDKDAVREVSMKYIEGFYEGKPEKLSACLDPNLNKYGFWKQKDTGKYQSAGSMSFEAALKYAQNVNDNKEFPQSDAPKKVELLDIIDKIAITKVTAWWGIDYMLLAKNDGKWMIRQIVWEGPTQTSNPSKDDIEGAKNTGLGYIEGFYEGDTAKLSDNLKTNMYKFGYGYNRQEGKFNKGGQMTFDEAIAFAKQVKESKRFPSSAAPKVVEVLDVMNHIAAIKVTAWWGVDYMLLSKNDNKWMIEQVLWASIPPKKVN